MWKFCGNFAEITFYCGRKGCGHSAESLRNFEKIVGAGFRQNGFFADFFFFGRQIFSRIFSPDFFSSFFVGKSAQKNPPGKSPEKSSKFYTTKILQHISADWPEQKLRNFFWNDPFPNDPRSELLRIFIVLSLLDC